MTRPKIPFPTSKHPQSQPRDSNPKKRKHSEPSTSQATKKNKQQHQPSQAKPIIPFNPHTRILLVGEGDFSFAASLIRDHGCADILATSYEPNRSALLSKYPHAEANLREIESAFEHEEDGGKWRVQFGVDARRLDANKLVRRYKGRWERVWFNFPHCGGRSRDVNRQVRFNQELLSEFFGCASKLLRTADRGDENREFEDGDGESGSIIVTLFEGEPYTLWNVRDLARNKGLGVKRSWEFDPSVYPGYRHARTVGVIKKGGMDGDEESTTAWKGEERPTRTYEFGLKGDTEIQRSVIANRSHKAKKGNKKKDSDSDSE